MQEIDEQFREWELTGDEWRETGDRGVVLGRDAPDGAHDRVAEAERLERIQHFAVLV